MLIKTHSQNKPFTSRTQSPEAAAADTGESDVQYGGQLSDAFAGCC